MSNTHSLRFVLFATGVSAIGGFLFGYDTAVINGANAYLKLDMGLNASQEGLAAASAILGCIPGAMCAGFLSDRFGRRKMLFLCALLYAASGILSAIPETFGEFLLARFFSGLGIGASSMICPVYIVEIAPPRWRGRMGALFQLGIVSGIFFSLFANNLIQGLGDEDWNTATGWRWMMGMEALPAFIFVAMLFRVPESPRWLAHKGKTAEAAAILSRVGGPDYAAAELDAIAKADRSEDGRFSELFRHPWRKPMGFAVLLAVFQQFCGINAVIYYSTKMFSTAGESAADAFTASVWVGLVNLVFTFVAIAFVDKAGRRPLLLMGTAAQTVALALIGWLFFTGQDGFWLLAGTIMFIAAFAMATGPITWLLCSEFFPNKVRGRAMSVATFAIWTSCFAVAQTFPMMNDSPSFGPAPTFWFYAAVSLSAFVFVLMCIPETKGRTLEEIEKFWNPASKDTP